MLRSLLGFNWHKSNAHLLLLSKFVDPKTMDDFRKSDAWKKALGESPERAIKRFLKEGMLTQAGLTAQLDYRFEVTELKDMLRKRGLPVSGRKIDLIQRLLQADPEGMNQAVVGLKPLICTKEGRKIAEVYLANERAKRSEIEQQVMKYLRQRKFKDACVTVASYEAEQVFPRGTGINWKHYNPAHHITILNCIFDRKPKILARLDDEQSYILRLAAGMMYLWGTNRAKKDWLPPDFETGLAMDNHAAARMFIFHATYLASIADYKQMGVIKRVKISAAPDSCDACKKISARRFKLSEVPELPYEHCTHKMGCRCAMVVIGVE